MKFFISFLVSLAVGSWGYAQKQPPIDNLVPNPSFELTDAYPIGWYYKGKDFDKVMKYWESPTSASPDAYTPKVRVPASWAENGFGKQTAHTGKNMVGVTLYGCADGKPHCREYIQIQLKEPLVIGQTYAFELWYAHLQGSMRINNLGAYFSDKRVSAFEDGKLNFTPQIKAEEILYTELGKWTKYSASFEATSEAEYLIIGNFETDKMTNFKMADSYNGPLNFAYYYIDDVNLHKTAPVLNVPIKDDDLTKIPLEVGKTILLKNIYFDTDQSELLPRSYVELNKLLKILKDNPKMSIEIMGHTDNVGAEDHNLILSKQRAEQVSAFLTKNGIASTRLTSSGHGSAKPIANNDTEDTRQLNRRVEFKILKK
jgi:OmpA-OmpF porin, OOP family